MLDKSLGDDLKFNQTKKKKQKKKKQTKTMIITTLHYLRNQYFAECKAIFDIILVQEMS